MMLLSSLYGICASQTSSCKYPNMFICNFKIQTHELLQIAPPKNFKALFLADLYVYTSQECAVFS